MEYFGHSGRNGTELTTLLSKVAILEVEESYGPGLLKNLLGITIWASLHLHVP